MCEVPHYKHAQIYSYIQDVNASHIWNM